MTRFPWRLAVYAIAALLILAGLNHGLGFIPFTPQWSAKRSAATAARLEAQVSSLERTAEGNAAIGQAVQTFHTREIVVRDATSRAIADARSAPDAATTLSDERADRLRRADGILCDATGLCPTAAPDAP